MAPLYATETLLLGSHGEIHRGAEVPTSYLDSLGAEHDTDFDRLEELGLVSDEQPSADAPAGETPTEDVEPEAIAELRAELGKKTKADLLEIGKGEGLELDPKQTNAALIDALVAHAAAQSAGETPN